jgi:hypothetical protein
MVNGFRGFSSSWGFWEGGGGGGEPKPSSTKKTITSEKLKTQKAVLAEAMLK